MASRVLLVCALAIIPRAAIAAAGRAVTFYVSPAGSDANPGTAAQPFKTLAHARDALRAAKLSASGRLTIILRGGAYYLAAPLRFDERDSGAPDAPITYRNHPGELPVLIGGSPVTRWQRHRGCIFKALIPGLKEGRVQVTQLLEDGVPGWVARAPNEGWFRMASADLQKSFRYDPADFAAQAARRSLRWDPSQLEVHLVLTGTYFSRVYPVEHVDLRAHRLYVGGDKPTDPAYNWQAGRLYVIQNALQLLDAPGEFYADRNGGYLYYWPRASDIGNANIVVAAAANTLRFEGLSPDRRVRNVVIEGCDFKGSKDDQIAIGGADRITIRNCRLLDAGRNGIAITGASTHITVTGCEIAGCGENGVNIRGEYVKPERGKATVLNYGHVIHDNYIHHVGRLTIAGCGVTISWSGNSNVISHNLLTDMPKAGVLMFSMWDIPREYGIMNDNVIRSNEFARCGNSSWDGGSFYIGATTDNTVFENNRICDTWSSLVATWPQPDNRPEDDCAIDFDPGMTFNTHIRNNVCYGENAYMIETGRPQDEMFLDNNYFESPVPGCARLNSSWTPVARADLSKVSMDIGLTAEYPRPYPRETVKPVQLPLRCGFEGTLSPLFLYLYSDGPRQEFFSPNAHDGRAGLRVDKDIFVARYRHPSPISRRVTIWMYDDPRKRDAHCMVTLRGPWATDTAVAAMGVSGAVARDRYVVQVWNDRVIATDVRRSAGWHKLVFDIVAARGCRMSLDGRVVGAALLLKQFNIIDIGDATFGSDSRGLGFDSLSIE
jgi:hypothetical protein